MKYQQGIDYDEIRQVYTLVEIDEMMDKIHENAKNNNQKVEIETFNEDWFIGWRFKENGKVIWGRISTHSLRAEGERIRERKAIRHRVYYYPKILFL